MAPEDAGVLSRKAAGGGGKVTVVAELVISMRLVVVLLSLVGPQAVAACGNGGCQLSDLCLADSDCAQGLECSQCPLAGDVIPRCFRAQATSATALDDSLPFNKYAWLTTHNAFSWFGAPLLTGARVTLINQEDAIASQLEAGVRGLMLDAYDFRGDIWLCHSSGGVCNNFTAFEPLNGTLAVIQAFLTANPTEIITLILEDYVTAPNGLSKAFDDAGLMKYFFPPQSMPQDGGGWPTIRDMVAKNWRLLVFTSKSAKEYSESIPYQWKYMVENQYGDGGQVAGQCPNRAESAAMSDPTRSLLLLNYFSSVPVLANACVENADPELHMLSTCYAAAGNRWANYLAVDFYKRSQGGGAFQAVDYLNGQMRCGCASPTLCLPGYPRGTCLSANAFALRPASMFALFLLLVAVLL